MALRTAIDRSTGLTGRTVNGRSNGEWPVERQTGRSKIQTGTGPDRAGTAGRRYRFHLWCGRLYESVCSNTLLQNVAGSSLYSLAHGSLHWWIWLRSSIIWMIFSIIVAGLVLAESFKIRVTTESIRIIYIWMINRIQEEKLWYFWVNISLAMLSWWNMKHDNMVHFTTKPALICKSVFRR